jgi:NAD(P)-dependent dehydrogenase (short-subunit alcohol dehydrogenase family)
VQTDKQVWFVTGAGRGMGVDIAQAALTAGRAVVATGRNTDAVADAIGEADDLLVVALDVTSLVEVPAVCVAGTGDGLVNRQSTPALARPVVGWHYAMVPSQIWR